MCLITTKHKNPGKFQNVTHEVTWLHVECMLLFDWDVWTSARECKGRITVHTHTHSTRRLDQPTGHQLSSSTSVSFMLSSLHSLPSASQWAELQQPRLQVICCFYLLPLHYSCFAVGRRHLQPITAARQILLPFYIFFFTPWRILMWQENVSLNNKDIVKATLRWIAVAVNPFYQPKIQIKYMWWRRHKSEKHIFS